MELTIRENDFLNSFDEVWTKPILNKNKLSLFVLKINANEFDYDLLERNLLEPMINYSVSRLVRKKYKNKPGELSKKARKKFKESSDNTGELGELLLYCFLETHLKAPKILSKLELKTSTKMYVNGSDGVHLLKLDNGNFQLIFGESKMYEKISDALEKAFESIKEFKEEKNKLGDSKSGIKYEKALISDNLNKETFSNEEKKFIESIIYPKKENEFEVDDAFGIFIGYQMKITEKEKMLENDAFKIRIKEKIDKQISQKINVIEEKIKEKGLTGHNFYIYVVPFTEIDKNRIEVLDEVLS